MHWHAGLEHILARDVPLAEYTTFGIGGPVDYFLTPSDSGEFARAYAAALRSKLPVYVLGGGSNVLIRDNGIRGVVIRMPKASPDLSSIRGQTVIVDAGLHLGALVRATARVGLAGLEVLVGVPGTVGGALRVNAGGRYGSIGDRVSLVWLVDEMGRVMARRARDIQWGYRQTSITEPITAVEFHLEREPAAAIERRMGEILGEKRSTQPMDYPSAGCFFKNPPGRAAGRLIDESGLKGLSRGGACVSEKHANFIVNKGGATASDVLALAEEVRARVRDRFDTELEPEVRCWPQDGV